MQKCDEILDYKPEFAKMIAKSIVEAIGDDIKLDIIDNDFDTNNGTPARIWDYINRNLGKNLSGEEYSTNTTKCGRWEMKPIFSKNNCVLYTLMREERLIALRKEVKKRKSLHYLQALAYELNADVPKQEIQMGIFVEEENSEEEEVAEIVAGILEDLMIPNNIVKNHVVILFSSSNYVLKSLRICVIKGDLSIVAEKDWSNYIEVTESDVVEHIDTSEVGIAIDSLRLKDKATNKLKKKNIAIKKAKNHEVQSNDAR